MAKKSRTGRKLHLENFETALRLNGSAKEENRKRKSWTIHDLKSVRPITPSQEDLFCEWLNDSSNNILAHGSAGTGKSFLALYLALGEVLQQEQQKIIIVRSAVPAREIGFTPGTEAEKMSVYESPYHNILHELVGRSSTYQDMKDAGLVEFVSTSFIRGVTWDNSIIIFDEIQNATWEEINTVITRVGYNSRIILCGDIKQNDLHFKRNDISGFDKLIKVASKMNSFKQIHFTQEDIVRCEFVKEWIIACENVA